LSHASRALAACSSYDEIVTCVAHLLRERFSIRGVHIQPLAPELAQRFAGSAAPFVAGDSVWCALRDATTCRAALELDGLQPAYGDLELITALLETASISIGQVEAKAALAEGARFTQQLRRYVPGRVVDELSADGELVLFGGKQNIAVMFADIRGFTALSEQLDPDLIVQILNVYFVEMCGAIEACGGTLDKFIGDAVMAFWGAPKPVENAPLDAARAAMEMQRQMPRVNRKIRRLDVMLDEPLSIGVGIASGSALVGNIGTARLTQYTAIGDVVNVASRLCGQAGPGEILIDGRTAEGMGSETTLISQGPMKLKGRDEPVQVYKLTL
jgi:class 3 adenylate cyclase